MKKNSGLERPSQPSPKLKEIGLGAGQAQLVSGAGWPFQLLATKWPAP